VTYDVRTFFTSVYLRHVLGAVLDKFVFNKHFLNDITYYLASNVRRARKHDLEFHPVFPDRLKFWLVLWMGNSRSNVG